MDNLVAKVGENSLDFYADDRWQQVKGVAAEHRFFHWDLEFPDIFYGEDGKRKDNPGFDGVVGNPPYVEVKKVKDSIKPYLYQVFQYEQKRIIKGRFDIFWAFIFIGINILRKHGKFGFLTEDSILDSVSGDVLRRFILEKTVTTGLKYVGKFPTAGVHTVITLLTKIQKLDYDFSLDNWISRNSVTLRKSSVLANHGQIINLNLTQKNKTSINIFSKIEKNSEDLGNIIFLQQGIIVQWGSGKTLERKKRDCIYLTQKKDTFVPYIEGKDVSRYTLPYKYQWLDYRPNKHHRPRIHDVFTNTKLLVRRIASESLVCVLDHGYYFVDNTLFTGTRWCDLVKFNHDSQLSRILSRDQMLKEKELVTISEQFKYEYILAILNSKLMTFYYEQKFKTQSLDVLTTCKIKRIDIVKQKKIAQLAMTLQNLHTLYKKNLQKFLTQFQKFAKIDKIPKQLEEFYKLDFECFMHKIHNKTIDVQQYDLKTLFVKNKQKISSLKIHIQQVEDEIDKTIYELYGLTDDDIKTVEELTVDS